MKKLLIFLLAGSLLASCQKDALEPLPAPHPVMLYKNLQNAEVAPSQPRSVDINNDGQNDFSFGVLLVGDPILQRDRLQYLANSKIGTNLLNNEADQSPMLNKNDLVTTIYQGYQWFEISAIVLAEKITTMTEIHWDGLWKNSSHNYLPVQIKQNGKLYNGWIELSFDTAAEKLILHKAAISTEENKPVKAGY